jgi:dienelactone hydrolase
MRSSLRSGAVERGRRLADALRARLASALERSAERPLADPSYLGPPPIPEILLRAFEVPAGRPRVRFGVESVRSGVRWIEGRLDDDGAAGSFRGSFEWFRPLDAPTPRAGVLVFPVLGGPYAYTRALAHHLARRGFETVMPHRIAPFLEPGQHGADLERIAIASVREARCLLAWLEAGVGVGRDHLGVVGVSLGSLLATVLLAVEPTIRAGVLAVGGGDVATIVLESEEPRVIRYRRHRLLREKATRQDLRADFAQRLDAEPLTYAPFVDARKVLFVTATRDRVVPRPCNEALWRAIGRPERMVLRMGHYSTFVAIQILRDVFGDFLGARLLPAATSRNWPSTPDVAD